MNIAKFQRTIFYIECLWWLLLDSNLILATHLYKSKKKPFLYFDNSHAKQTNTTKKIWFFSYILNINENLKKKACIIEPHMLIKYRQLCSKNVSSKVSFVCAIYCTSKHFCACVGACTCNQMSLLKGPG